MQRRSLLANGFWVVATMALLFTVSGCAKYKVKIANQENEIANLKEDKAELEAEKAELEAKIKEIEAAKQEADRQLEALTSEKTSLEGRIADFAELEKELKQQLEDLGEGQEKLTGELENKQLLLKELRKRQALAKKRLRILKNMLAKFKKLIAAGKLNVSIRRGKMVLEMPSAVLFDTGSAELSAEGQITLTEVAKVLSKFGRREFQVAGHTDSVPITSDKFPSNWELSTARAVTVVKFLAQHKVKPTVLSAAGYSKYQPIKTNKSEQGKAQNRRIEITLMPDLDELPDVSDLEKELKKKI